jgi:hypothetical protein
MLSSCQKPKPPRNCYREPDIRKPITFIVNNEPITINAGIYGNKNPHFADCLLKNDDENESFFQYINSYLQPISKKPVISYLLYTNLNLDKDSILLTDNIKGFSFYYIEKNKFNHKLFTRYGDKDFREIKDLSCETRGVITNFWSKIFTNFIPDIENNIGSYFHLGSRYNCTLDDYKKAVRKSREMLNGRIKIYSKKLEVFEKLTD